MSNNGRVAVFDATLRDGGYYTSWDFPDDLVDDYVAAIAGAEIAGVEIGYRSPLLNGYRGRFYYTPKDTLVGVRAGLRSDQVLALMFNTKECTPADVAPILDATQGYVDMVRQAVAPKDLGLGIEIAREIKQGGFRTALNVMYLSHWHQDPTEVLDLLADQASFVDVVNFVDSYGACFPDQVGQVFAIASQRLANPLGFHGHDNLSLALANSIAAIDNGATYVDATILGMGRGAGNLRTELIIQYLGAQSGQYADMLKFSRIVDRFQPLLDQHHWGTNIPYSVAAFANLPQADVMDWLGKRRYSTSAVVEALQGDERTVDRRELPALKLDAQAVPARCLLIGGGATVPEHATALKQFCQRADACVIHSSLRHVDLFADYPGPQIVCMVGHEATKRASNSVLLNHAIIPVVTEPPRNQGVVPEGLADRCRQVHPFGVADAHSLGPVDDVSPLSLALGVTLALGFKHVDLAGFDGYSGEASGDLDMSTEVHKLLEDFQARHSGTEIISLTPTRYPLQAGSVYHEIGP